MLVNFCSTHYGHTPEEDVMHLRLPKDFKLAVSNKLLQGVTIDRILDDIRDSVDEGGLKRCHHSTKKDIQNIKRVCNVDGVQKHSNDYTSVAAWVEELKSMEFCPVIAFKPQGVSSEREGVKDNDFLLALQTQFQLEMMKAFGGNVICVDATHSTNYYEYLLVTVMVVDDFGEGIPVAWAITTREDTCMLAYFFLELRKRTGPLSTQVFMSDDATQYWSAWTAAYSSINTTKLLCAWHVDRAWRKALKERIPLNENRIDVYHHLRTLLTELQPDKFRSLLQKFVSFLSNCHPQFCSYFQRNYTPRVEEWATCYRIGKFVNTNMYLESFHRVLKIVYLEGKKNRRLDQLIHILLKLARNKAFEQVQKVHKGKTTYRINEINRRHKESSKMISEGCHLQSISNKEWKISSQTTSGRMYTVHLENQSCPFSCKLRCAACDVCIHMYNCSCVDSVVHTTICKHIHATCFLAKSTNNATSADSATESHSLTTASDKTDRSEISNSIDDSSGSDISPEISTEESRQKAISLINDPTHLSTILSNAGGQIDMLKKSAFDHLHQLHTLLTSSDSNDAVRSVTEHIKSGINVLKAYETRKEHPTLPIKSRSSPSALNETQIRFQSIKNKRPRHTGIAKPSVAAMANCKENLSKVDINVCVVCYKEDDRQYGTSDRVHWAQCSKCNLWLHTLCGRPVNENSFLCNLCT